MVRGMWVEHSKIFSKGRHVQTNDRILLIAFLLGLTGFLSGPALAQLPTPIGKVVSATGPVTIQHADAVVVQANVPPQSDETKVGDLVYLSDIVQTGQNGRVGINFIDGTSFNLSSNSRMVMNEFVYDPNGTSNSTLLSLTKGTFTFIAGRVAKTGDMKIDTPVATMGIRGTTPHIEISDDGSVKFSTLIEEGKSKVLQRSGSSGGHQNSHN